MVRNILALLLVCAVSASALEEKELREGDRAEGNFIITYCLQVPKNMEPEQTYPLIVCFHGRGGRATHHAGHVLRVLKTIGLDQQVIVLGAKSQADGWEMTDHEPVTKLIEWALATLPVDPRRVYTHGMSSGGSMSGTYALTHPELIAAGVVYGSGINYGKIPVPANPSTTHPDLYLVMGQKDDDDHKNSGASATRWLTEKGFHHIYRFPEDLAHSPDHPLTNRDNIEWLLRQRHKTIALPAADLDLVRGMLKADTLDDTAIANLARIGGAPAAAVVSKLVSKRDVALQTAALKVGMLCCLGDEAHTQIGKRLMKSPEADIRNAVITLYDQDAKWRYSVAIQALQQIVNDKKRDIAERDAAATGLATAASFQVRGNYQDPDVIISLVKLMDDDEESLRTIAWNVLKPAHESPYVPTADKGGRSAGLRSFQQWAMELKPIR